MTDKRDDEQARPPIKRRDFLVRGSISAAALIVACGDDEKPPQQTPDADMLGAPDMSDSPDVPDEAPDAAQEDMAPALTSPITKPTWVHLIAPGAARLRFETDSADPLPVQITRGDQAPTIITPQTQTTTIDFSWPTTPFLQSRTKHPDLAGDYTLQEIVLRDLAPGQLVRWSIGDDERIPKVEGSFLNAPAPGTPVRVGWISDTMAPNAELVCEMLAKRSPELLLHGGDIQYITNPFDTWNGIMHAMAPITAQAAVHLCIGNHEYESFEDYEEFDLQYVRLFGAQTEADGTQDYHVVNFGSLRFLMLNSEIEMGQPGSPQNIWLREQLANIPQGIIPIPAFHRPYYTFSRSRPSFDQRDYLHQLFVDSGVPLVLTGHNHCYERFDVDGMHYIVDGGGGALSYDVNMTRNSVLMERPEDEELRKVAQASFGALILSCDAENTLTITRYDLNDKITDTFTIRPR